MLTCRHRWSARYLAILLGWVLCAPVAQGAKVQARLDRNAIYLGTQTLLVVDVAGAPNADWPVVEPVAGVSIQRYGQPNSMRDLFRGTVQLSFRFLVSPERAGVFQIPSVTMNVGGQKLVEGPLTLRVIEAALQCHQVQIEPTTLLVNERARLNVSYQGSRPQAEPVVPEVPGLSIRRVGSPQVELVRETGMPITTYQYHVTALKLGRYTIKGIALEGVPADPVTLTVSSFVVIGARAGQASLVVGGQTTVEVAVRGLPPSARPKLVAPAGVKIEARGAPAAAQTGASVYAYTVTATEPGTPAITTLELPDGQQVSLPGPVSLSVRQAGEGGILACQGTPRSSETVIGEPFIVDYEVFFRGDLVGVGIDPAGAAFANRPYIRVEPVNDLSYPGWAGQRIRVRFGNGEAMVLSGNGEFNGRKEQSLRFALRITPLAAGELALDGLKIVLGIQVKEEQRTAFSVFMSSRTEQYERVAEVPSHNVIDPPGIAAPPAYRGAVGTSFTFVTELDRTTATAMSPLTLTMKITSETVGPEFKPPLLASVPELTRDFDVSPTIGGGEVTDHTITFTQVIRPRGETVGALPALPLAYYDYEKKRYETVYSLPIPVEITPGSLVGAGAMEVAVRPVPSEGGGQIARGQESPAAAVALGANFTTLGQVVAPAPLSVSGVIAVLVGGPGGLALIWVGQRLHRWRRPASRLRQQRRRLWACLAQLGGEASFYVALAECVQSYLRLTFGLPPGEVSADALAEAFARRSVSAESQREIRELLAECDTGRFAAGAIGRAEQDRLIERTRALFGKLDRV